MALGRAYSVALTGLTGHIVEVEADVGGGLPGVHLVGLPDTALQEARDRIRAAVTNAGEQWPRTKVVLALSPATLHKVGSLYDLALACAVLNAQAGLPAGRLRETVLLGELALDGRVRAVRGVLPAVLAARDAGCRSVVVPSENLGEAAAVRGIAVHGTVHLAELAAWLRGRTALASPGPSPAPAPADVADLSDVVGQLEARRALEIAAAGAHNLMLTGSPGVGKTLLAQRLPGILPALTEEESLEATAVHSTAGLLTAAVPRVVHPPFVAPHHTTSVSAMVGGGSGYARPGAVSIAHRGVLFLDECAELPPTVLEALRTPLEDGEVRIARRDGVARYPARFQLVLAANPCPCAPAKDVDCVCTPTVRRRYLGRLSGPLLDRVDLRLMLRRPTGGMLTPEPGETSVRVRERVTAARTAAAERWRDRGWTTNSAVPGSVLRREFRPPAPARAPIETALRRGRLTPRGVDRCLRVAWTLADLAGHTVPTVDDTATALYLRDRSAA
ncbi:YifB family Mg chelatase-like AAA ATPase [Tomitella cavernea]|uniref:YifB family Mg chelatase-like AAA ATPase n=1 Tax=Tomitella cavernea TaxID=1387982 RepID=A0ABP9CST3_9ACTN|nr:YifB family Mg chelatase-like AAA ATPase [Tomitella cavernea]